MILKSILFSAFALLSVNQTDKLKPAPASNLRFVENKAFGTSEHLKYRLHYGFINAGVCEIKTDATLANYKGRQCYHVVATGTSNSSYDWIFKVRDRYESYIDIASIAPMRFVRDVNEDGFIIKQDITFDHLQQKAACKYKKDEVFDVPSYVQDLVSGYYYARATIDFNKMSLGQSFTIPIFLDYEIYPMTIKFIGRETINTGSGKFRCVKFRPMLQEGRIFKDDEDMTLYISDDLNKIPVMVKADILIGSIKMSLTQYSGLRNPLTSKIN